MNLRKGDGIHDSLTMAFHKLVGLIPVASIQSAIFRNKEGHVDPTSHNAWTNPYALLALAICTNGSYVIEQAKSTLGSSRQYHLYSFRASSW